MLAYLLLLVVAGEVPDDKAIIAKSFDRMPTSNDVGAPIHYADTVLIVSTKDGVAAIQFTKPIATEGRTGMEYRYRFLETGKAEQTGTGSVFERAGGLLPEQRIAQGLDPEADSSHPQNQTLIRAGKIELIWSLGREGKGFIYYAPEEKRVQMASGVNKPSNSDNPFVLPENRDKRPVDALFRHDLTRFRW